MTLTKKRLLQICLASFIVAGIFLSAGFFLHASDRKILRVGLSSDWKLPLHPGLQHNVYEGVILAHEFEPLVARGDNGLLRPLAARSFDFNSDYTTFVFKIDTGKLFSNGVRLQAAHFKQAWEKSLMMNPNSAQRTQADLLSRTIGFENFQTTHSLDGVKVIDAETLEIHFSKPCRMALFYLSGAAMGVFLEQNGKTYGTGPYRIEAISRNNLILSKNPYGKQENRLDQIEVIYTTNPIKDLKDGKIDVIAFNMQRVEKENHLDFSNPQEIGSYWLHLNGLPGRTFSSATLRRAFQSLVWDVLDSNPEIGKSLPRRVRLGMQAYLPFQSGRLDDETVRNIVFSGRDDITQLLELSKRTPIKVAVDTSDQGNGQKGILIEKLRERGLVIQEINFERRTDLIKDFYHEATADVLPLGSSLNFLDPDGIYQIFGEHGAVSAPMIQRPKVLDLLETGRNLTSMEEVKTHYEKVNRAILTEVPSVHLGMILNNYVFRPDKVAIRPNYLERHHQLFDVFEPKQWFQY